MPKTPWLRNRYFPTLSQTVDSFRVWLKTFFQMPTVIPTCYCTSTLELIRPVHIFSSSLQHDCSCEIDDFANLSKSTGNHLKWNLFFSLPDFLFFVCQVFPRIEWAPKNSSRSNVSSEKKLRTFSKNLFARQAYEPKVIFFFFSQIFGGLERFHYLICKQQRCKILCSWALKAWEQLSWEAWFLQLQLQDGQQKKRSKAKEKVKQNFGANLKGTKYSALRPKHVLHFFHLYIFLGNISFV